MTAAAVDGPLDLDRLGSVQFERLCLELLDPERAWTSWDSESWGGSIALPAGVSVPHRPALPGPALVLAAWLRPGATRAAALADLVAGALAERRHPVRSLLLITNAGPAELPAVERTDVAVFGAAELWRLYAADDRARFRAPAALGVSDLSRLLDEDVVGRSSADVAAAAALARVFVPTRAHSRALAVLERNGFVVLTGPPEMGKTAIARMIGLAALTAGREVHECVSPDELWRRYARDRAQVFVADDAFGSTEYRPEAAERWAVELDRVLRAMDARHWLLWTSRPAPLRAGLRRVHREHGVERFPQPAEVQVDAARLDVAEKALILFRHAREAEVSGPARRLVRAHGWRIVSHAHFTPERIRRFVHGRLVSLADSPGPDVAAAVAAEIREPTAAMSSSYRALSPEHRAVLHGLLDCATGPASERDLAAAIRRHSPPVRTRRPEELVDRLADHFLRRVEPGGVAWVHPSWRDLVIDELAADAGVRAAFLRASCIHGAVLALSTGGGAEGERLLPLLRDDGDWDVLADRLAVLVPELDPPEVSMLLAALGEARRATQGAARREVEALAQATLALLARTWDGRRTAVPVGLLAAWLELALRLPEAPSPPALAATWIELVPTAPVDTSSATEIAAFDDWTAFAELLSLHLPDTLAAFGFPAGQAAIVLGFVAAARGSLVRRSELPNRDGVVRSLRRLAGLVPAVAAEAWDVAGALDAHVEAPQLPPVALRELPPELQQLLETAPPWAGRDEELVARVLRDL